MKTAIVFVAVAALALAACSSSTDEAPKTDAAAPSGGSGAADTSPTQAPEAAPTRSQRTDVAVANQQSRVTCEWFAELINDVNAGLISGVQGDVVSVGETRYRIKNMYGLSIGSDEPIHPTVKALMGATQLEFKFEDVRPEVDALREACEQNGYPIPELTASSEQ
jgi:hypothetical protein